MVSIVLPESDGSIDASSEDWTTTEKNNVVNEIIDGLLWWLNKVPSNVDLTIWYITDYDVPISYEPITRSGPFGHYLWIGEIMDDWGYVNINYFYEVYDYNNDLRDTYGTDWVFAVFVVDSSNDADGAFSDGYFGYAYLGLVVHLW